MRKIFFICIILTYINAAHAQKVVRVTKGYVALEHENVGKKDEMLIIRRYKGNIVMDVGVVRVVLSKQGRTAAKIEREIPPYKIQVGDIAYPPPPSVRQNTQTGISHPWQFRLGGGIGLRIGDLSQNVPPDLQSYNDKLKSGFGFSTSISYFYKPTAGFGWKFSQWGSNHSAKDVIIYNNETVTAIDQGNIKNNIMMLYTGPALLLRLPSSQPGLNFTADVTAGLYQFQDTEKIDAVFNGPSKETIKGQTFGIGGSVGLEYRLSNAFGLYGNIAFLFGSLPKQNVQSNLYQDRISLSRLDLGAGFWVGW